MTTILIVDDDKYALSVLEGIFQKDREFADLKLTVVTAEDGQAGLEAFRKHKPALVVTDLLMPKLDGFELCKRLRAEPDGDKVALLVSSGVFRDSAVQKRLRDEFNASFYAKPYQIKELTEAVAKRLGISAAVPQPAASAPSAPIPEAAPRAGSIDQTAVPVVLLDLLEQRATGTLTLKRAQNTKVVQLVLGHPVAVASNIREETLGYFLVQRGEISDVQHQKALEIASTSGTKLGAALVKMGVLTSARLIELLAAQTRHKIVQTLRWRDGTWAFAPGPEEPNSGQPLDPEYLVLHGLKETAVLEDAHRRCQKIKSNRLHLNERGKRLGARFATLIGGTFAAVWSDGESVNSLVRRGGDRDEVEIAVEALLQCGALVGEHQDKGDADSERSIVSFGGEELPSISDLSERTQTGIRTLPASEQRNDDSGLYGLLFGDANPPTRAGERPIALEGVADEAIPVPVERQDSGVIDVTDINLDEAERDKLRKESEEARKRLAEEYLRTQGLDHYQVLNVLRDAKPAAISTALDERKRTFSLEAFYRYRLGRDYAKLEELHRRYQQAKEVLLDERRRAEYDRELAGGDLAPSASALAAEIECRAGCELIKGRNYLGAITKLERAVDLAPHEADYHAELGWARFLHGQKTARAADAARPHLNQALRINPDHAAAHEYKGIITWTLGNDEVEAIFHLERALDADSSRTEALAALERAWRRRGELRPLERVYRKLLHRVSARDQGKEFALWIRLGELYKELDDLDSARIAYQSALTLRPDAAEVRATLATLGSGGPVDNQRLEVARNHWRKDPDSAGPGLEFLRAAQQANQHDAVFLAASVLVARKQADPQADEIYKRYRPRFVIRAQRAMNDDLWQWLHHRDDDPDIGLLFDLLAPVYEQLAPLSRSDLEIDETNEVHDAELPVGFARIREYIAHVLGTRQPPVYVRADFGHQVHVGAVNPPVLLVGDEALAAPERLELSYRLGRAMTYLRPSRALGGSRPARYLKMGMLAALTSAVTSSRVEDPTGFIIQVRTAILGLAPDTRTRIHRLVQQIAQKTRAINLSDWQRALARTADRAGLLFCGDVPAAIRFAGDTGGSEAANELADYALSREFMSLRAALGLSIDV
jgi:CheY-like chemotaxis protein/tetratricopeptide (TPR) repeat protein